MTWHPQNKRSRIEIERSGAGSFIFNLIFSFVTTVLPILLGVGPSDSRGTTNYPYPSSTPSYSQPAPIHYSSPPSPWVNPMSFIPSYPSNPSSGGHWAHDRARSAVPNPYRHLPTGHQPSSHSRHINPSNHSRFSPRSNSFRGSSPVPSYRSPSVPSVPNVPSPGGFRF